MLISSEKKEHKQSNVKTKNKQVLPIAQSSIKTLTQNPIFKDNQNRKLSYFDFSGINFENKNNVVSKETSKAGENIDSLAVNASQALYAITDVINLLSSEFVRLIHIKSDNWNGKLKTLPKFIDLLASELDKIGDAVDNYISLIRGVNINRNTNTMSFNPKEKNAENNENNNQIDIVTNIKKSYESCSVLAEDLTKACLNIRNRYKTVLIKSRFKLTKISNTFILFIDICKELNPFMNKYVDFITNNIIYKNLFSEQLTMKFLSKIYLSQNLVNNVAMSCNSRFKLINLYKLYKVVFGKDSKALYNYQQIDFKDCIVDDKFDKNYYISTSKEAQFIYDECLTTNNFLPEDTNNLLAYINELYSKNLPEETFKYLANNFAASKLIVFIGHIYGKIIKDYSESDNIPENLTNLFSNKNKAQQFLSFYTDKTISKNQKIDRLGEVCKIIQYIVSRKQSGHKLNYNNLDSDALNIHYANLINNHIQTDKADNQLVFKNQISSKLSSQRWSINYQKSTKYDLGFKNAKIKIGNNNKDFTKLPYVVVFPKAINKPIFQDINHFIYKKLGFQDPDIFDQSVVNRKNDVFQGQGKYVKQKLVDVYGGYYSNALYNGIIKYGGIQEKDYANFYNILFKNLIENSFIAQGMHNNVYDKNTQTQKNDIIYEHIQNTYNDIFNTFSVASNYKEKLSTEIKSSMDIFKNQKITEHLKDGQFIYDKLNSINLNIENLLVQMELKGNEQEPLNRERIKKLLDIGIDIPENLQERQERLGTLPSNLYSAIEQSAQNIEFILEYLIKKSNSIQKDIFAALNNQKTDKPAQADLNISSSTYIVKTDDNNKPKPGIFKSFATGALRAIANGALKIGKFAAQQNWKLAKYIAPNAIHKIEEGWSDGKNTYKVLCILLTECKEISSILNQISSSLKIFIHTIDSLSHLENEDSYGKIIKEISNIEDNANKYIGYFNKYESLITSIKNALDTFLK